MVSGQNRLLNCCLAALFACFALSDQALAADVNVSISAAGEEQQTNQPGLVFNNAIFGQAFPTAPNYFASTRVTAGRRISYQVTVTNVDAVNPSPNVVLSIVMPAAGSLYQGSLAASVGSCQVQTPEDPDADLICDLGVLAASAQATVTFQVVVDRDTPAGTNLLAGAAASIAGDTNLGNNFATGQNTVLTAADLTAALATVGTVSTYSDSQGRIFDSPVANAATAGNIVRHRVEIQNNGPSDSLTTLVKHTLPTGFVFVSADGADCLPGNNASNLVFCALSNLKAATRVAYDLNVSVDPFVANLSALQSCATAVGGGSNTIPPGSLPTVGFDPPLQPLTWDPLSNSDVCTSTTTGVLVDAGVSFEETTLSADERGAVHYQPLVINDGRSGLLSGALTLTFPSGIKPLGASNQCTIANSTATCAVMPLSPGESQLFDLVGSVQLTSASVSALAVQAALSGVSPTDVNGFNNTASSITIVNPRFDNGDSKVSLSALSSDFDIQSGTWGVNNRGDFFTFANGNALALVKPSKVENFTSGKLITSIRLVQSGKSSPNGSVVFAHQSNKSFRYVRLEKRGRGGRVVIGQIGDFGGEKSGLKAAASYPLKIGKVYNLSVEIAPNGVVDVRINNSANSVVSTQFTGNAQGGRIGFETRKARAAYNGLSIYK